MEPHKIAYLYNKYVQWNNYAYTYVQCRVLSKIWNYLLCEMKCSDQGSDVPTVNWLYYPKFFPQLFKKNPHQQWSEPKCHCVYCIYANE